MTLFQVTELRQLWELCSHGDQVTATTSCVALVKLVSSNLADFTFILNGFLNLVPTARYSTVVMLSVCVYTVWRDVADTV